jgi:hypothetical protein
MKAGRHAVWMPGGVRTEIHLGADQTAGTFCLLVDYPPSDGRYRLTSITASPRRSWFSRVSSR